MKFFRLITLCTLFLLVAVPSFAAPPCTYCVEEGVGPCDNDPGAGTRCKWTGSSCQTIFAFCINFADETVLNEWQVASIEISRPDPAKGVTKEAAQPAAIASVDATSQPTAQN